MVAHDKHVTHAEFKLGQFRFQVNFGLTSIQPKQREFVVCFGIAP